MSRQLLYIIASLLIVAGLILIVLGLQGQEVIWQAGLGAVTLAMLLSFATRWADNEAAADEQEGADAG